MVSFFFLSFEITCIIFCIDVVIWDLVHAVETIDGPC